MATRKVELVPVSDIRLAVRNPKRHDLAAISSSISRFGFADAVVVDGRTGRLVSGHGRIAAIRAMMESGGSAPDGVECDADGRWLVPVQTGWSSRDDVEAEAFIVAANRLVELGGFDGNELAGILSDLASRNAIEGTGYDLTEIEKIVAEANRRSFTPKTDEDFIPVRAPPVSRVGDIWALGGHRILCGDSRDPRDVDLLLDGSRPELMVTDPPYGVDYDPSWRNDALGGRSGGRATGTVMNDGQASWKEVYDLFQGSTAYVWHAATQSHIVVNSIVASGFELKALIIWSKSHFAIGRSHYHHQHEPCWYAIRKHGASTWQGSRKESTVWDIPKPIKSDTGHGTQKPVECMRRPIINSSAPGDYVFEPFSGSGTTIIACQETGRRCLAIEIHPPYVDLAIARWEAFTGLKAERVHAKN